MATRIVRVGNTLTVEIPEDLVAQAALPVGEPLEWVPSGPGHLALVSTTPRKSPKQPADMTLEELLEGLGDGDCLDEYDWGRPGGVEVW